MSYTVLLIRAFARPAIYFVGGYLLGRVLGALIVWCLSHPAAVDAINTAGAR